VRPRHHASFHAAYGRRSSAAGRWTSVLSLAAAVLALSGCLGYHGTVVDYDGVRGGSLLESASGFFSFNETNIGLFTTELSRNNVTFTTYDNSTVLKYAFSNISHGKKIHGWIYLIGGYIRIGSSLVVDIHINGDNHSQAFKETDKKMKALLETHDDIIIGILDGIYGVRTTERNYTSKYGMHQAD
jgi:hypothetical protein